MKNREVLQFANGLKALRSDLEGRHFAHAVTLNLEQISPYVKAINKASEPSEDMNKYLEELEALNVEYAEKDENGNPVINYERNPFTGDRIPFYSIPDNMNPVSEFSHKKLALIENYKEVIEKHKAKMEEWQTEFLEEVSAYVPVKIEFDKIPDNVNTQEMQILKFMIK